MGLGNDAVRLFILPPILSLVQCKEMQVEEKNKTEWLSFPSHSNLVIEAQRVKRRLVRWIYVNPRFGGRGRSNIP